MTEIGRTHFIFRKSILLWLLCLPFSECLIHEGGGGAQEQGGHENEIYGMRLTWYANNDI